MILTTERLTLRPATPADAADLHGLEQDPEVMRYLNGGQPTPLDPGDVSASPYRMPRGLDPDVWAAFEVAGGRFVGWFSLGRGGKGTAELGYRLRRDAWGRGYGSEGAAALVAHGFETLGLKAIHAETMAVNIGSRRVMERIGMRHLRTFFPDYPPSPGDEEGEVEYGITAEAWFSRAV